MNLHEETLYNPPGEDSEGPSSPLLQQVHPVFHSEEEVHQEASASSSSDESRRSRQYKVDPGDIVLLQGLGPNHPDLAVYEPGLPPDALSDASSEPSPMMVDQADDVGVGERNSADAVEPPVNQHAPAASGSHSHAQSTGGAFNAHALKAQASEATSILEHQSTPATPIIARVDSGQSNVVPIHQSKDLPRVERKSPLRVETGHSNEQQQETIATSPNLRKHVITVPVTSEGTLPALQHSPTKDGEKLPSFRQLSELAKVAEQQDPRVQHHHRGSFGSATNQSPMIPYHFPPGSAQTSPSTHYAYSARSPKSAIDHYGSPTQIAPQTCYANRRPSMVTDYPTPLPASLPSASSSGESGGHNGSSIDGYSTQHTTPIDPSGLPDGTPRPILPPPAGMPLAIASGYPCDFGGCTAPPFQTQYLLSSHRNVHSQSRPHYCPVEGCSRADGGRGFKRKNEMVRHGLVHSSPGYVCPFCPDREHRYPRPDNLQRHVRVHHPDKDRDDQLLREVLAQRNEGNNNKTRRRRANTNGSATS